MEKSRVYHDQKPSFGLSDMGMSEKELGLLGLQPAFTGGPLTDRFKLVALVDSGSLDEVFRLTNHIDCPWTDNEKVEPIGNQHRSTSVGDLVRLSTGKWYVCAMIGWKEVEVCE
jgi:hypothetical protein